MISKYLSVNLKTSTHLLKINSWLASQIKQASEDWQLKHFSKELSDTNTGNEKIDAQRVHELYECKNILQSMKFKIENILRDIHCLERC